MTTDPYVRVVISRFVSRIRTLRYLMGWGDVPGQAEAITDLQDVA